MHKCSLQEEFVDEGTTNERGESRKKKRRNKRKTPAIKSKRIDLSQARKYKKMKLSFECIDATAK